MQLRLGHSLVGLRATLHNGPGWRVAIWVQGCRLRCTAHCLNPHYLASAGGHSVDTGELVQAVVDELKQTGGEGITVLGGEPTDQASAVAEVLAGVRAAGFGTMVYTGHIHETLVAADDPGVHSLMAATDLLVDGPFVAEAYDEGLPWRGSANQRLLCLGERYTPASLDAAWARQRKGWSLRLGADGSVSVSGMQTLGGARAMVRGTRS